MCVYTYTLYTYPYVYMGMVSGGPGGRGSHCAAGADAGLSIMVYVLDDQVHAHVQCIYSWVCANV